MRFKELLVVIPHSGVLIPREIPVDSLSEEFSSLILNVDWHTNWLYDFRDILGNSQLIFPFCSIVLEANRHPDNIEDSVPLKDTSNKSVFKPGFEPNRELRQLLAKKYLRSFHQKIKKEITNGTSFILDAHSTVTAKGVADRQIELMNFQVIDDAPYYFCPQIVIETYANQLVKKLPDVKVTVNKSGYNKIYGHVCGEHSINKVKRAKNRVPAILQETNQHLYMNADGSINLEALEGLRRAFAEALYGMKKKIFH